MTKIKFISDLHLEFSSFPVGEDFAKEVNPDNEDLSEQILLVAGDTTLSVLFKKKNDADEISYKRTEKEGKVARWRFSRFLHAVSGFKAVYLVAGNHEAYSGGDVLSNKALIQEFIDDNNFTNVKFLERERVPLTDKVDLLATTLWTDMNKDSPGDHLIVGSCMNDFRFCNYGGNKFTTRDALREFRLSKLWLTEQLADTSKSYVVMTHHLPSFRGIDPQYKGDPMNFGYASELDDFILQNQHITHWVHGHTHYNVDYKIGETRILGHMRGYPNEVWSKRPTNWKGFKINKCFSI